MHSNSSKKPDRGSEEIGSIKERLKGREKERERKIKKREMRGTIIEIVIKINKFCLTATGP